MKEYIPQILISVLTALIVVVGAYGVFVNVADNEVGSFNPIQCTFTGNASTISSSTINTTSKEVLERNVDRCYGAIVNDGGNPVYLALSNDTTGASSTAREGIRLNANGGSIEFDNQMPYAGAVQAIVDSGTSTLTVIEY